MADGLLHFDWDAPLSDEERDHLLHRAVKVVRKWRLEVPAVLFLESGAALSPLAGQGLIAFSPFAAPLLPGGLKDVQRLSKLLSRPENVRLLIDRISDESVSSESKDLDAARK